MLNQNDYVTPRSSFALPATWKQVMREADANARRRVEDEAPPMDTNRLRQRNERMAAYPNTLPQDTPTSRDAMPRVASRSRSPGGTSSHHHRHGGPAGGGGGSSDKRIKREHNYEHSQFPDSRGYFSGNESSTTTSASDARGYRRGVRSTKTPSRSWQPPHFTTPAAAGGGGGTSPQHHHQHHSHQDHTNSMTTNAVDGFVPREIPPAAGRTRVNSGEHVREVPLRPFR